jgi:hypothetical protein
MASVTQTDQNTFADAEKEVHQPSHHRIIASSHSHSRLDDTENHDFQER